MKIDGELKLCEKCSPAKNVEARVVKKTTGKKDRYLCLAHFEEEEENAV